MATNQPSESIIDQHGTLNRVSINAPWEYPIAKMERPHWPSELFSIFFFKAHCMQLWCSCLNSALVETAACSEIDSPELKQTSDRNWNLLVLGKCIIVSCCSFSGRWGMLSTVFIVTFLTFLKSINFMVQFLWNSTAIKIMPSRKPTVKSALFHYSRIPQQLPEGRGTPQCFFWGGVGTGVINSVMVKFHFLFQRQTLPERRARNPLQ